MHIHRPVFLIITAALFLVPVTVRAQYSEQQISTLRAQAETLESQWQQQRSEAEIRAALFGLPLRVVAEDGSVMELQRFVDERPEYFITNNAVSAATISTSRLFPGGALGFSLTGAGITIAEWDGGSVRTTHQELRNRVTQMDNTSSLSDHATHVAGTMIASGVRPEARGMAPEALLLAHDWNNDLSEMTARAADGVQVSNHSYGTIAGWRNNYRNDGRWAWFGVPGESADRNFGRYETRAREWDQLVASAPYFLPVKSAGNDRGEGPSSQPVSHWVFVNNSWSLSNTVRERDGGAQGYDCIPTYGNAKNILTVGAVEDIPGGYSSPADVRISSFSGWGPTDDGRIKPDIVANGVRLYSSIRSSNSAYASYSGTSMSAPSVTGSIALLLEQQKQLHGTTRLRASTIKALLLHTADEAGPAPGPDYTHGWGLMNTAAAVRLMSANAEGSPSTLIREAELRNGQNISIPLSSPGRGPLKVTICWTDRPGPVQPARLNPTDRVLVNDLDLRVIDPNSGVHFPWTLNPASPASPATRGDNNLDNVEQVWIHVPEEGNYIVRITHKGSLQGESQYVSIVASVSNEVALLSPPNGLTNSSITPALQWNTARGALSYEIQIAETADFATPVVDVKGITETWYDTPPLKRRALYFWRVRVRDTQGVSDWSDVWSFATGGHPTLAGHALQFDGSDDYVLHGNVAGFSAIEQNDAVTIEAWVYVHSWVDGYFAVAEKYNPTTAEGWSLRLRSSRIEFTPSSTLTCNTSIPLNTWTHVAVTYSKQSGKARFYVNGTQRCENNHSGDIRSTAGGPFHIGATPSVNGVANGIIDELRIWNAARAADDINAGMFSGYTGSEPGLVAQWDFNEGRGLTAVSQPGAIAGDMVNGPAWIVSDLPMEKPPAPIPLYPMNNGSNIPISVVSRWAPATSALRYRVQLSREANFSNLLLDARDVTATTQTFPSLLPETGYYWRVNSTNALGTSDWSAPQYFVTAVAPPDAPKLTTPKDEAMRQPLTLSLFWEPPARSIRYHVQVSTDSLFAGAFLLDDQHVPTPQIAVPDLGNNQRCYWRVRALNFGGSSPWSEQWAFTTIPAAPEAPVLLTPEADERGVTVHPQFIWSHVESAVSYGMQLSTDPAFGTTILDVSDIPFARYAASYLERGTWYYWRARAANSAGTGDWSATWRFLTERDAPEAVQLIAPALDAENVSVRPDFSWQPLSSADTYSIELAVSDEFDDILLDGDNIASAIWTPVENVPSRQTLYWRVRAVNERGAGAWSEIWHFTTGDTPLDAPALRLPPDGSTQTPEHIDFVWMNVETAETYTLEIGQDTLSAISHSTSTPSLTLSALDEEREFHWRVRALRASGEGPWSDWWTFTTTLRLPDAVELLTPIHGLAQTSDTVLFVWTRSEPRVDRYWLEYSFNETFLSSGIIDSSLGDTSVTIVLTAMASPCYWRVRAGNSAGWGPFSATGSFIPLILGVKSESLPSAVVRLDASWPQPARTAAVVSMTLPVRTRARLELRDALGRIVRTHDAGELDAGPHTVALDFASLPSGRYLLVLHAAGGTATRGVIIAR
jgi:hypothetical protein